MLSPDDISQRRFLVALRGYDRDEVATFLQEVASEVRGLRSRIAELEAELARESATTSPDGIDTRTALAALGEETTRILVAAEDSAREIEAKAAADAESRRDDAQREARETVERANRQAARTIAEAERRRDAVAAEIAELQAERDRFVDGLRASVASIGGVVGGLAHPAPEQPAPEQAAEEAPAPAPEEADEDGEADEGDARDVVVAPDPAPAAATTEPVVLEDQEDTDVVVTTASTPAAPTTEPVVLEAEKAPAEPAPDEEPAPDVDDPAAEAEDTPPADEDAPTVETRRTATLDPLRTAMARQCKRGLQEIQNEVLASLREHGRAAALDDLLPGETDLDELGAQGSEQLTTAYTGALADAAAEVDADTPADLADGARVPTAVATFRAVLAHEVTSSLRATLRAGLEAEEPEPQLSERVGEVFRDLRGPVIEAAVDEHLQRTYGHGLLDAWQQLGVEQVRWEAHEEPRCPEGRCRTNAAEGPVALGDDFPSGDRVPPAHFGCTCVVVPVTG